MSQSKRNPHLPPWLQDVPLPPRPPDVDQLAGNAPLFAGLPEWLRDEDEAPPPATPDWLVQTPELSHPEPDWLPVPDQTVHPPTETTAPPEVSPPSWLQSLRATIVPPAEEAGAEPTPFTFADEPGDVPQTGSGSDIEAPSWLIGEQPTGSGSGEDVEAPSWLIGGPLDHGSDESPEQHVDSAFPPASGTADEPVEPVDLPAWLRELPVDNASQASPAPQTASRGEELPAWLRDIAAQPPAPPAAPSAPGAEPAPPAGDLPDWLTGALSTPDIPSAEEKPVAPPSTPSDLPDWLQTTDAPPGAAGLPDWLRGAEVPAASDAHDGRSYTTEPAAPQGSSDLLSGMDLPEWLRIEPEPKPEPPPLSGRDLDWLTRLGSIAEDETITSVAVTTPKLPPPPTPKRSEEQVAALSLLKRLAAEPIPAATPLPLPEPAGALQRIGLERMLSMVLLILIIVAIMVPGLFPALETPPAIPGASEIYRQIAALGANDVVLIGYEWDARRVGELRPLEQAVIGQLIAQDVKLILVSTDPQGTLLQFDLLDTLRGAGYRQQGEGYLLLGYKPGGEMALRMVGRDFQTVLRSDYRGDDATGSVLITGVDTGRPIARLNDLSLIIVLADDTPDVQGWMEQVYPQAQTGDRPVSLVFLLPEEAAPIVQPYMRQSGVAALAGRRGALAYAALGQHTGSFDPVVARSIAQQRLATLLFALVLLVGLAGVGGAALRRRRS
ncbi:hypothetical protein [Roseiflexus sp.]